MEVEQLHENSGRLYVYVEPNRIANTSCWTFPDFPVRLARSLSSMTAAWKWEMSSSELLSECDMFKILYTALWGFPATTSSTIALLGVQLPGQFAFLWYNQLFMGKAFHLPSSFYLYIMCISRVMKAILAHSPILQGESACMSHQSGSSG